MAEKALIIDDICINYRNIRHMSIHQSILKRDEVEGPDIYEAVKHVSFDVEKGEILGIIGRNGSGKSTMLRAIAGIFRPDTGKIDTLGHRISLMSIGVGFKPDITGRENIMTSGMLLGFNPEYIKERMPEIVEFSELGEFIDKPVRTYSSGMYSKLSFSITAIMDPDVMLVDEVLSVGDVSFREKSFNKMQELINDADRTVLIVSHDLSTLSNMCNRVLWLHDGEMKMIGETQEVLEQYKEFMKQ